MNPPVDNSRTAAAECSRTPSKAVVPIGALGDDRVLRDVYASDQAMYPAALPYERLQSWVAACPGLSVCFRDTSSSTTGSSTSTSSSSSSDGDRATRNSWKAYGLVIVLPLRRAHWERLLDGRLKEADVDAADMFADWGPESDPDDGVGHGPNGGGGDAGAPREEIEVGLHVYHIERNPAGRWVPPCSASASHHPGRQKKGGFTRFALDEVLGRARGRPGWRVVGMSALTATPAGKKAFENLGFKPTGYRELFVVKDRGGKDGSRSDQKQVEMICLYAESEAAGHALDGATDRHVVSESEMAVKYL